MTGPKRRVTDHVQPDYWTELEQHRFEDKLSRHLEKIEASLESLANRLTLIIGGLVLLSIALPLVAPFIRDIVSGP